MSDALDVDLRDDQMVDEIRLVTELMVIASMNPGELDQDVIDEALGVTRTPADFPAQRQADDERVALRDVTAGTS
jgi:hypothetical protein